MSVGICVVVLEWKVTALSLCYQLTFHVPVQRLDDKWEQIFLINMLTIHRVEAGRLARHFPLRDDFVVHKWRR